MIVTESEFGSMSPHAYFHTHLSHAIKCNKSYILRKCNFMLHQKHGPAKS